MKEHTGGIHAVIREKVELANAYAQDGAFHSAARIFAELAETVKNHAGWASEELKKATRK